MEGGQEGACAPSVYREDGTPTPRENQAMEGLRRRRALAGGCDQAGNWLAEKSAGPADLIRWEYSDRLRGAYCRRGNRRFAITGYRRRRCAPRLRHVDRAARVQGMLRGCAWRGSGNAAPVHGAFGE